MIGCLFAVWRFWHYEEHVLTIHVENPDPIHVYLGEQDFGPAPAELRRIDLLNHLVSNKIQPKSSPGPLATGHTRGASYGLYFTDSPRNPRAMLLTLRSTDAVGNLIDDLQANRVYLTCSYQLSGPVPKFFSRRRILSENLDERMTVAVCDKGDQLSILIQSVPKLTVERPVAVHAELYELSSGMTLSRAKVLADTLDELVGQTIEFRNVGSSQSIVVINLWGQDDQLLTPQADDINPVAIYIPESRKLGSAK